MATIFNTDIGLDGEPNMTSEMIEDFKLWSRAIGGEEGGLKGVKPDLNKYIKLGFCRNTFIQDMENSDQIDIGLYDPIVEEPEYTYYEWEQAKINEIKEWRIQAKHSDHFYHETERLRDERNLLRMELAELKLKQLLGINNNKLNK